jgi:hypothetical protein
MVAHDHAEGWYAITNVAGWPEYFLAPYWGA